MNCDFLNNLKNTASNENTATDENTATNENTATDEKIEINEHFKIPIYYNEQKKSIKENIITDLELVKTVDPSLNSIYSICLIIQILFPINV